MHAGPPAAESWGPSPVPTPAAGPAPAPEDTAPTAPPVDAEAPDVSLEQLRDAWTRSVLPAVQERSIPVATLLGEATPTRLDADTVTLAFPSGADFHRRQVDEPRNLSLVREALYEVTGRRLAVATTLAEGGAGNGEGHEEPLGEANLIALLESDLNATEVEERE